MGITFKTVYVNVPSVPQPVRLIETGSGPSVFFLHGGPAFAGVWLSLMAQLRGFKLVAIDRPGYGLTGKFDYKSVEYKRFAVTFLEELFDTVGFDSVPIVSSSMGGLWALWFAAARPDRISSMVQLGCPPLVMRRGMPLPYRLLATPWINRKLLSFEPPGDDQIRKVFTRMGHSKATVDEWSDTFWNLGIAFERLPEYIDGWLTELETVAGLRGGRSDLVMTADDLMEIDHRTRFIWGRNDNFGDVDLARRITNAMPRAEIDVIDGGHLPWLDEPETCGQLIQKFLESES
jgi:pimeloyl-ACP methyl ester carboxylesterase